MYTHTYPLNEILVPSSQPRKCFVFQLSHTLQRLCHHFIDKNWHGTLFIFFSMQTEFLIKMTILINVGLTLQKELTRLVILLLIKVRSQKKPPNLFFHGLDFKPFSLRGMLQTWVKGQIPLYHTVLVFIIILSQFQLIILQQFDSIQ